MSSVDVSGEQQEGCGWKGEMTVGHTFLWVVVLPLPECVSAGFAGHLLTVSCWYWLLLKRVFPRNPHRQNFILFLPFPEYWRLEGGKESPLFLEMGILRSREGKGLKMMLWVWVGCRGWLRWPSEWHGICLGQGWRVQTSLNSPGTWMLDPSIFCVVCVFVGLGRKYGKQVGWEQPYPEPNALGISQCLIETGVSRFTGPAMGSVYWRCGFKSPLSQFLPFPPSGSLISTSSPTSGPSGSWAFNQNCKVFSPCWISH